MHRKSISLSCDFTVVDKYFYGQNASGQQRSSQSGLLQEKCTTQAVINMMRHALYQVLQTSAQVFSTACPSVALTDKCDV